MSWQDDDFDRRVRAALDQGVGALDDEIRARLAVGRRKALAQPRGGRWLTPFRMQYGLAAALLAGWVAVGALLHTRMETLATDSPLGMMAQMEEEGDSDILTDPAFYAWVDAVLREEGEIAG
jgi:hypothetical protein